MTDEMAATPGWVDKRLDELFAGMPSSPAIRAACDTYAACLARDKAPAAISDQLGAEFNDCRSALLKSLRECGAEVDLDGLGRELEALEAEIDTDS